MQDNNVQRTYKGLNQDSSLKDQPQDTYRFALNSTIESELGDFAFIGNEESNELYASLPSGYIPIGKAYMGNNETVLLLVSEDETASEIGILKDTGQYVTHVNDSDSIPIMKLNFKLDKQIQVIYRLRKGCERTIYFAGDENRPRYYNFDKPNEFKTRGAWDGRKFSLQRTYNKIPEFQKVRVIDAGGNLLAGSYNFAVQYLDESLNPTEWINTSPTVKVYNDLSSSDFSEIKGSINSKEDYLAFPNTGKAIEIDLQNLDTDFIFYRLAFIESTNGTGQISRVTYSETIPTTNDKFVYTGTNFATIGTLEEVQQFANVIEKAGSIEQVENRLLLGNTTGKQLNMCNLQKYASRIKADCVVKTLNLTSLDDASNGKNPTHEFGGLGYMPGEIYSFGIVWIFDDNTLSPVYHIPGKSPNVSEYATYTTGDNVYPMKNKDNTCSSVRYSDNDNCGSGDYWSLDSEGVPLVGKYVRHHRFPLRSEIGLKLVEAKTNTNVSETTFYNLELRVKGNLKTPIICPTDEEGNPSPDCKSSEDYKSFEIRVNYNVKGESFAFSETIDPEMFADGENTIYRLDITRYSQFHSCDNPDTDIIIESIEVTNEYDMLVPADNFNWGLYFEGHFVLEENITVAVTPYVSKVQGRNYTTKILGIQFSGIEKPSLKDTNGKEIIGYYIVRNDRTEFDKTILDTGILTPTVKNDKYTSHGLLVPDTNRISSTVYGLIHPEHKFQGNEYTGYDEIIQEGTYDISAQLYGKINYDDVYDGSSYNSKRHKGGNDDGHDADGQPDSRGFDGWSLNVITRDNIVDYRTTPTKRIYKDEIANRFYLDALGSRTVKDYSEDVYNITSDNKVGIVEFKTPNEFPRQYKLPYVTLKKYSENPYSNFRILPYYKETINPVYFSENHDTSQLQVYNGDSYVSPMRYTNSMFWDNRVARRKGKGGALKIVLGAFLVVLGAVLSIFTAGASTILVGAGIAIIGAGALIASSGLKMENANKAYLQEYDKGLRETTLDDWVDSFYNYKDNHYTNGSLGFGFKGNGRTGYSGPSDDTISWIGECLTDVWFESSVNINLRNGFAVGSAPTFLNSPWRVETGNNFPIGTWEFFGLYYTDSNAQRYPISSFERHMANKLLTFDEKRDDNRLYIGVALGEYYNINKDYMRKNKEKIFFHLPLEYDCCSECQETFPHRVNYSEQSFQEELTDNYRIFLPNNYTDIQGESGKIVNIFTIGNNLFVHTQEALWLLPKNYQERVTDQIVSFIGTGSYFSIPPQKILDDSTGNSAGTKHKWGSVKTPQGYFFISENQNKIYQFDGKQLTPISNDGISVWFKKNMAINIDRDFHRASGGIEFPYRDNPSNPVGSGYILVYDSYKERLIVTKRDYKLGITNDEVQDFQICYKDNEIMLFQDFKKTIEEESIDGWRYLGIEDCRLKFSRELTKTRQELRGVTKSIYQDVDFIVFEYVFTDGGKLASRLKVNAPYESDYIGNCKLSEDEHGIFRWSGSTSPDGIESMLFDVKKFKEVYPDTDMVEFLTEAWWMHGRISGYTYLNIISYWRGTMSISNGKFINTGGYRYGSTQFPLMNVSEETEPCPENIGRIGGFTYSISTGSLLFDGIPGGYESPETRQTLEVVDIEYTEIEFKYIDGTLIHDPVQYDNSWTLSYNLKLGSWTSWHTYTPNMYISVPEKFYSWKHGLPLNPIWKHNVLGNYLNFYGKPEQHILEYVAVKNPTQTTITNHLQFQTEAKRYLPAYEEFVEDKDTTFNKLVVYNSRQNSGVLNLKNKDTDFDSLDYFSTQTSNTNVNDVIITRREKDWFVNDLRDNRIDLHRPMWLSKVGTYQNESYIDKVINSSTIDYNKDWTQLETFRDKYLVVRLIFDSFAPNTKLVTNYTIQNEQQSFN